MFSKLEYKLIKTIQSERTERINAKWTEPKRNVGQIKCAIISIIKVSEEKEERCRINIWINNNLKFIMFKETPLYITKNIEKLKIT